jgi:hypothetical protein
VEKLKLGVGVCGDDGVGVELFLGACGDLSTCWPLAAWMRYG